MPPRLPPPRSHRPLARPRARPRCPFASPTRECCLPLKRVEVPLPRSPPHRPRASSKPEAERAAHRPTAIFPPNGSIGDTTRGQGDSFAGASKTGNTWEDSLKRGLRGLKKPTSSAARGLGQVFFLASTR